MSSGDVCLDDPAVSAAVRGEGAAGESHPLGHAEQAMTLSGRVDFPLAALLTLSR